ncbi:MAG: hypothetical protein WCT27_04085 [Patescibacteria group bacterium]
MKQFTYQLTVKLLAVVLMGLTVVIFPLTIVTYTVGGLCQLTDGGTRGYSVSHIDPASVKIKFTCDAILINNAEYRIDRYGMGDANANDSYVQSFVTSDNHLQLFEQKPWMLASTMRDSGTLVTADGLYQNNFLGIISGLVPYVWLFNIVLLVVLVIFKKFARPVIPIPPSNGKV